MELKKGVLSGLRVVDFGQYIAGPAVSMILGDYGADVIHIDPPKGPVWNEWECNAALMRGKRSISLDLKNEKDLDIALKLIDRADILVENFHPGVMDRLGLGWETLEKRNPGLIYCSLPGFSKEDEKRCDWPGWEGIVSAEGGLYSSTDYFKGKDTFQFDALPLASMFAAVIACHSIAAALIVREKCGRGQYIESSLYDACFEIDSTRMVYPKGISVPDSTVRSPESKNASLCMRLMNNYPCKDGRYIKTTPPPRGQVKLCKALFPESWLREGPPEDAGETVRQIMLTRTMREWEEYAQTVHGAGVSVSLTSNEWLHEKSTQDSRTSVKIKDPVLGDTLQPGVPSLMMGSGDSCGSARHLPNADSDEIIRELEREEARIVRTVSQSPELPLKGIKILDLSQVVAGPTAGRLLAEYGAEVIKINNPRFADNFTALVGHETQCNGKKTMLLDIKSDDGRRIMDALIRECDVFHSNFSQEAYMHLGFTEEDLRKKNPDIIVSQVNIHSLSGGREWMRGHEDLGEAASGMSLRYSGTLRPQTLPILVLDHMTGHMSALGVVLAVYERLRNGKGQKVQACLSRSATLVQLPYMIAYKGKVWNEPSGPDSWGFSPYDRMYEASDGYIYLHSDPEAVKTVPELAEMPWDDPSLMENAFCGKTCSEWESICCRKNCFARKCRIYRNDLCSEEYAWKRGIVKNEMHPGLGMIRTVHCAPRMSLTPPQPGYPSAAPGYDTESIINSLKERNLL